MKKFLVPVASILATLATGTSNAAPTYNEPAALVSKQELTQSSALKNISNAFVLLMKKAKEISTLSFSVSHRSHRSHSSHRSHRSAR